MYFPYVRGRQYEMLALRELANDGILTDDIIPIIEPVKDSSSLIRTLETFVKNNVKFAVINNPKVGDFYQEKIDKKSNLDKFREIMSKDTSIIKAYIMDAEIAGKIKNDKEKSNYLIINENKDSLKDYLHAYDKDLPLYTLIPGIVSIRRAIKGDKILLEDNFNKRSRNVDYLENDDEHFTDTHLYYEDEGYKGFSDYTIVGKEYNESGFMPIAVALHIVYFDEENNLRVHHFVSDSNDDTHDVAGKFGEALEKLVIWCEKNKVPTTKGLQGFYDCYYNGSYPGLGSAKKYSIMHHIELVGNYLGEKQK